MRAPSAPPCAESSSISSVTGSDAIPAASGDHPVTTCRVIGRKKKIPDRAA
ncbi:hypothetical protein D3C75_1294040 [compost metagenome]